MNSASTKHRLRPSRAPCALFLLFCVLVWTRSVFAQPVAIVTDGRVAQYREAVAKARETLQDATVLDLSNTDVAAQLRQLKPSVVLTVGQKALDSAKTTLPDTPIVYCLVLGSPTSSSKTITGVRLEVSAADQLTHFRQIHPKLKRIAVLYQSNQFHGLVSEARKAVQSLGIEIVSRSVSDGKEVRTALAELLSGVDALWLFPDPQLVTAEMFSFLLVSTLERKIALFGFFESFTKAGALASVSPDYAASGERAAKLAQSIAQKPVALRIPVPPPVTGPGVLTVNQKTASRLDLELSQDVLGKAYKVFR